MPVHVAGLLQFEQVWQSSLFGLLHHALGTPADIATQQIGPLLARPRIQPRPQAGLRKLRCGPISRLHLHLDDQANGRDEIAVVYM